MIVEYDQVSLETSTEQSFPFTFEVSYDMEVSDHVYYLTALDNGKAEPYKVAWVSRRYLLCSLNFAPLPSKEEDDVSEIQLKHIFSTDAVSHDLLIGSDIWVIRGLEAAFRCMIFCGQSAFRARLSKMQWNSAIKTIYF